MSVLDRQKGLFYPTCVLMILGSFPVVTSRTVYIGCYIIRDEPAKLGMELDGVVDTCMKFCLKGEYTYAGLSNRYCICSRNIEGLTQDNFGCTTKCRKNMTQSCGGMDKRISVYATTDYGFKSTILPVYTWIIIAVVVLIVLIIISAVIFNKCRSALNPNPDLKRQISDENQYSSLPKKKPNRNLTRQGNVQDDTDVGDMLMVETPKRKGHWKTYNDSLRRDDSTDIEEIADNTTKTRAHVHNSLHSDVNKNAIRNDRSTSAMY